MSRTHLIIPEYYDVTEEGVVVSARRQQTINNRWGSETTRWVGGRKLKPQLGTSGYFQVNCGEYRMDIHRLVAIKYVPNPEDKPHVNHKDGNKQNNHKDNLEWVTHQENMTHSVSIGLWGGAYGKQKLIPSEDLDKEIMDAYLSFGSFKAMGKVKFKGCNRTTIGKYVKARKLPILKKVNKYAYQ